MNKNKCYVFFFRNFLNNPPRIHSRPTFTTSVLRKLSNLFVLLCGDTGVQACPLRSADSTADLQRLSPITRGKAA